MESSQACHGYDFGDPKAVDRFVKLAHAFAGSMPTDFQLHVSLFPHWKHVNNNLGYTFDKDKIWEEFLFLQQLNLFEISEDEPCPG